MEKRKKNLTEDQVREIHKSKLSNALLAERYGVSVMSIWRIKAGVTHQNLRLGATRKYHERRLERELTAYYKRKKDEEENDLQ